MSHAKVSTVPWVNSGAAERRPGELCELLILKLTAGNVDDSVIEIIRTPGVNLECRDTDGNTPLIIAAEKCRGTVVRALLFHGANVNAANTGGDTALYKATSSWLNEVYRRDIYHSAHKVPEFEEILAMIIGAHSFNKYSDTKLALILRNLVGTRFEELINNRKPYVDGGKRRSKKSRKSRKSRSKTLKTKQ